MGQIIIDIPVNENLHFGVESKQEYETLMNLLERFRSDENMTEDEEDAHDLALAKKAKAQYLKDGISFTLEEIKQKYTA
jgi:predicted nucleic acid-binding protein